MSTARTGRVLPIVVLLSCAAGMKGALTPGQQATIGEQGLAVHHVGDSVVVRWLSQQAEPGRLLMTSAAPRTDTFATAAARAHRVAFRRPRGDSIQLRYGAGDVLSTTTVLLSAPRRPAVTYPAADSIFIIGDTHGMFDQLVAGLTRAHLIDSNLHWTGGRKQLVFAGDLTDRGPQVTRLLWLVYRLEREAARAGGRVHVVLGNHETMVMLGDLRYVHGQEESLAAQHAVSYDRLFDPRASVLGRWLASKPALIRIGRVAIVHGGVAPEYAEFGIRALDDTLATYIREDLFYQQYQPAAFAAARIDSAGAYARLNFFTGARSLLWHRAYVQSDDSTAELARALQLLEAEVMVVGHTAVPEIQDMHDGRLIAVHTPRYGGELLLLVRDRTGMKRFRIGEKGIPELF